MLLSFFFFRVVKFSILGLRFEVLGLRCQGKANPIKNRYHNYGMLQALAIFVKYWYFNFYFVVALVLINIFLFLFL